MGFLTSLFATMAGNVVLGWFWRRALEIAGWLGVLASIYAGLPPEYQWIVVSILTGQGGTLTVGAVLGFAVYVVSQVLSFRATVRPQVVLGGKKVPILTDEQAKDIEEATTGLRPTHIPRR